MKNFFGIKSLTETTLRQVTALAHNMKSEARRNISNRFLEGKTVPLAIRSFGLVVHIDIISAIIKSGGYPLLLPPYSFEKSIYPQDFAHTLSNHHQLIIMSDFDEEEIRIFTENSTASVMCSSSKECNPIPVLSQFMSMIETGGTEEPFVVSYIGNEEATLRSWVSLSVILGFTLRLDTHHLSDQTLSMIAATNSARSQSNIVLVETTYELVRESNYIVIGDTRHPDFIHNKNLWHINESVMKDTKKGAVIIYSLTTLLEKFVDIDILSKKVYPLIDASVNQEYLVRSLLLQLDK
jgi:ornithine carbamoyltransferase